MNNLRLFIVISIIIILITITINSLHETKLDINKYTNLSEDGYIILLNKPSNEEILSYLPKDYVFMNYKYVIKGCSLSTYHRDVTSSQYEFKTKYPVYTYIWYKNNGELLSLCPGSHKTVPYCYSRPKILTAPENTGVIFNCDVLHAGALNKFGDERHAEQYKIIHIQDYDKLIKLDGIQKVKHGNCNINITYEYISRKISLLFPYFFNHILTPYLQEKQDSFVGKVVETIYARDFYNK